MNHRLGIATAIGCILVVITVFFVINQTHPSEITYATSQEKNDALAAIPNHIVLTNCDTNSDGMGKIDVSCPYNGIFHLSRDPPIKESKWHDVQLIIDNGQFSILYTTPTGTIQYNLVSPSMPGSTIFNSANNVIQQFGNYFKPMPIPTREELYQYALKVINKDRIDHGLNPVTLSNISSAQNHANDMINENYFSHWNTVGVKPYVTYTKFGGRGAVNENISVTGTYCPTTNCKPNLFDPYKQINDSEYGMMYNDAGSNWGHRDNIIDPEHTNVNIGIAYSNEKFYFVEHFENNIIKWQTLKLDGNRLHLVGQMPAGYSLNQVEVYVDPNSKSLTSKDLNGSPPYNIGHYDQGVFVGVMLPRAAANYHYPECSQGKAILDTTKGEVCVSYVTYSNISNVPNGIDIFPDVSKWMGSGLHTIYVSLKKQNGEQVYSSSVTLEHLK